MCGRTDGVRRIGASYFASVRSKNRAMIRKTCCDSGSSGKFPIFMALH
ncbi:MAG TPA: hypothetical protein VGF42_05265 [Caulobacteraceae bacterium]